MKFHFLFFALFLSTYLPINSDSGHSDSKEHFFEYIYVDANTGQSSGGHSAVKFGEWVYHFQFYPDEIFHIVRESWFDFRFSYNIQGNRSLEVTKVYPQGENSSRIEKGFNRLYLIQEKHLNNWKEMKADVSLLGSLLLPHSEYRVEGLGYFQNKGNANQPTSKLQEEILNRFGKDFFQVERNRIYNEIQNLNWKPHSIDTHKFNSLQYPVGYQSISYHYNSLLQRLGMLDAIEYNLGLDKESLITIPLSISGNLSSDEKIHLTKLKEKLEKNILDNIEIHKPSHSYPNLLELLTYLSIMESLDRDQFVFLDTFATAPTRIQWKDGDNINSLQEESYLVFEKYRKYVFGKNVDLQDFIDLQDSANRYHEIYSSKESIRSIRHTHAKTLPKKTGLPTKYPLLPWDIDTLKKYYNQALENRNHYKKKLEEIYSYQLILQNCTSEIFFSLDKIFHQDEKKIQEVLGKRIDPLNSLSFIPFYSSIDVRKNFHKTETRTILSYRRDAVSKLKKGRNSFLVDAKESFVPTSSLYTSNSYDHKFLFFTDDTIYLRPVYGMGNLITGVIVTSWGLPYSLVDRGDTLMKGVKSVFFAMPELVFFNINKGSFLYLRLRDLDEKFPNENQEFDP